MRYLAIDYGAKRTGLAICDEGEMVVSPVCVIEGQKELIAKIARVVREEKVGGIVVGLPLNMDDSAGPAAKVVCDFAERLKDEVGLPVHFEDERLSSFSAEQKLRSTGYTRGKKKKRLDAIAAAEILERFLERKSEQ